MSDRLECLGLTRLAICLTLLMLASGCTSYEKPPVSVNEFRLKSIVSELAAIKPPRCFANPKSLDKAAALIRKRFKKMGYAVAEQAYQVEGVTVKNLIVSLGPRDAPRYVLGAHYDVCGNQPGADDNASGVAGLLEVARLMKPFEKQLTHGIDFVAFTLEEPPFFRTHHMGSYVHARSLRGKDVDVEGMIALDMIGYFSEGKQNYPIGILSWFYPTKANFIAVVGGFTDWTLNNDVRRGIAMSTCPVCSIKAPAFIPGIDFSDHMNYRNAGFDGVMVTDTAFNRSDHYHRRTDTPNTLNYLKMAEVVKGVFWMLYNEVTE